MPIVLLVAYATGIALVCFTAPWDLTGQSISVGILFLGCLFLSRTRWGWLPFLSLLLIAGFLNASSQLAPPSDSRHVSHFVAMSPQIFEGRVLSLEKRASGGYRLRIEALKIVQDHGLLMVSGDLLLYIQEGVLSLSPGQIIRWRSPLQRPHSFGSQGEFDYPRYLASQGIYATSFVVNAQDIVVFADHSDQRNEFLENWRLTVAAHIEEAVPEQQAGLVQALLLGIRGGVGNEQRQVLAESGVAHLFAISGLHFGLLALLLYQLSRGLYTRCQRLMLWNPPQRILPILLLLPLSAYLLLTGNAWATQRAFVMLAIVAFLFAKGRRTPPLILLASVALGLLLFNPLALFQPGFQLSFAGVAGILAWLPGWLQRCAELSKFVRWPLTLILTTTAATMATAPATLWHFHQLSPAGILTNLIAIPLIAWGAVPLGLLSMALLPVSESLAECGLLLTGRLVQLTITVVTQISQWPGMKALPIYLTSANLIVLTGLLLTALPWGRKRHHWYFRSSILLTTLILARLAQPQPADFQLTALSVGQGDATLISFAEGEHYLVDGGGLPGSSIDPGEQLVGPALGRMGIDHLEGVILTHNHPDHSSGLTYLLERFPVEKFYLAAEPSSLDPALQKALEFHGTRILHLEEGWTHLQKQPESTLSLFVPAQRDRDINERSIAVYAGQKSQGVLLTADLGKKGLQQLKRAEIPGPVTLLKLPHHGSRHSAPRGYIEWLQPDLAFISSGRDNSYGFPHQETIDACQAQTIPIFRTDLQGSLIFYLEKGRWQTETHR